MEQGKRRCSFRLRTIIAVCEEKGKRNEELEQKNLTGYLKFEKKE